VSFTVSDFRGLIQLLEAQPEWKAQLLRVLFPNAFLDLPRAVEALAEAQQRTEATLDRVIERMERGFAEAAADRQRIWEAIRETNERMERGFAEAAADRQRIWEAMERGFAEAAADRQRLRRDISELQRDVRDLKGDAREQYYRSRATGIFSRRLLQGHEAIAQVADQLRTRLQEGLISAREYDAVLGADLLWGGTLVESGESVVLVMEVSWRVEPHDVERAEERARTLRKANLKGLPVAAGKEWPGDVESLARERKVVILRDGSIDEASWQAALELA
jgi:hypothetical protein